MMTMEEFKTIPEGKVFRVVVTRYHTVDTVNGEYPVFMFVCKKGQGLDDWAIYYHFPSKGMSWITKHGEKVKSDANILSLFPCDPEVLAKYRH